VMMEVLVIFVIVKLQNLLLCVSLDELGNEEMAFVGFFLYLCWFISILYL
jgi:hypothetical protein